MAAITKIEFWSDVGFIDGAVEIPRLAAADPTNPDMVIEPDDPIMPSKDRFFSELKLKEYYTGLLTMSYMRITYDLKNSMGIDTPNVFYGWIDKVDLSSDGEYPMTIVSWHIDEWRTWKNAVTFGSGHVKRRPFKDLATTPIQNYPVRYVDIGTSNFRVVDPLEVVVSGVTRQIWWLIVSFNRKDQWNNTTVETVTTPIWLTEEYGALANVQFIIYNPNIASPYEQHVCGPSISQLYGGYLDDILAKACRVAPEAVNGAWISPIAPIKPGTITGTGTYADPLVFQHQPYASSDMDNSQVYYESDNQDVYAFIKVRYRPDYTIHTKTFTAIKSSEEERFVLTSPDGAKICELPYDFSVDTVSTSLIVEPDGPYLEFSFKNSTYGNLIGTTVNSPLFECPLNSNAYASYVYSGKQEYDREMRVVQSNANAWKNTTTQTAQGAMYGTFGPQGLVLGAAAGFIGGMTGYGVEMLYQNDEEQRLEDRLQANQPSSLILSGNMWLVTLRKYGYVLKSIVPDSYSSTQITATRNQFGISVDELMSSCDTLIRSTSPTGYYNIQNMIVNGNVPVSAKKWIREKFRSGVRLV